MEKEGRMNLNVLVDDLDKVKKMMIEDQELNRSAFIRQLIAAEYERRHPAEKGQKQEESEEVK